MRLVMYTQVVEDNRAKSGDEYVVAHLTPNEAIDLGQAGMQALVSKAADQLPKSGNTTHDYWEYMLTWELLDEGELTPNEDDALKYDGAIEPCRDFPWPEEVAA